MDNTIIGLYQCIHDNNKPYITISHYHKMKGQRQIISSYLNDHNLLNAERYTTDGTIPPYKTTSI